MSISISIQTHTRVLLVKTIQFRLNSSDSIVTSRLNILFKKSSDFEDILSRHGNGASEYP